MAFRALIAVPVDLAAGFPFAEARAGRRRPFVPFCEAAASFRAGAFFALWPGWTALEVVFSLLTEARVWDLACAFFTGGEGGRGASARAGPPGTETGVPGPVC